MKTTLTVVGAAGRMGLKIISLAAESGEFEVVCAVERQGHPDIGRDAATLAGKEAAGVEVRDGFGASCDVAVDFSSPPSLQATVDYCRRAEAALVVGTTGLQEKHLDIIKAASAEIAVLYATNMSVGMNVLFDLAADVAAKLADDWDVEITEQHHRYKKDAPSGSALTLAERICGATGREFPGSVVRGRSGSDALRKAGEIGVHAVRAGGITGTHEVIFGTAGETLTLKHTAQSRDIFARGALRAARWIAGRKSGLYSMSDVLRG